MPNLKNAKKALRQSVRRAARNTVVREHIDYLRRSARKLLSERKAKEALAVLHDLGKTLDKAVTKRVVKSNTAARIKSRTAKAINAALK